MELIKYYVYFILLILSLTQSLLVDEFLNGITFSVTAQDSTQVTKDLLTDQSISECVCDITTFSCDQFCCCDPLCPPLEIEKWSNNSLCSNAQLQPYNYNCIDRNLVYKFNKRRGISESINSNGDPCYTLDNDRYLSSFYLTLDDIKNQSNTIKLLFSDYSEKLLLKSTFANFTQPSKKVLSKYLNATSTVLNNYVLNDHFALFSKGTDGSCIRGRMISFMEDYSMSCIPNITDCALFDLNILKNTKINGVSPTIAISSSLDSCKDFPISIDFEITRDSISNMITSVAVSYTTTKISKVTPIAFIPMTFTVKFISNVGERTQTTIGYQNGSPLKFKTLKFGLTTTNGECSTIASPPIKAVIFGSNSQTSCIIPGINPAEFCASLQGSYSSIIPKGIEIGAYSNFDSANATQWLTLPILTETDICTFDTNNVITYASSIILKITTTNTGSQFFPLNKILKADIALVKDTFLWPKESPTKTLTFQIKYIKAKTIAGELKDNLLAQNPPIPTILPWLPTNIIDPLTKIDY